MVKENSSLKMILQCKYHECGCCAYCSIDIREDCEKNAKKYQIYVMELKNMFA